MSNQSKDANYGKPTTGVPFIIQQALKNVNTLMPGKIRSYDAATQRAVVVPSLRLLLTDGTARERQEIANVPVVHPSGGGFSIHFPVSSGDDVLLLFCQRGITDWKGKQGRGESGMSDPDPSVFFSTRDAIALAGFIPNGVTFDDDDELVIQRNDGSAKIRIGDGTIDLDATTVRVNGTAI